MKKLIALLLCLVMIFTMAACSKKDASTSSDTASGETAENTEQTDGATWTATKSVDMIVPYGAGGGSDILARVFAANMDVGEAIVVQNISGGGTVTGTYEAYHADPDGNTVLMHLPETMMCNYLSGGFQDPVFQEMIPVCSVAYDASIICVSSKSDIKSVEDLVAYATANPGSLQWASVGAFGNNRFGYEQLCTAAGISANFIPYDNASESRTAVLGGNADVLQGSISESLPYIESGDLVPLAVMREDRSELVSDVPTLKELGYDVENGLHRAFWLPAGTPDEIVSAYENAFKAAFDKQETADALTEQGVVLEWMSGADLKAWMDEAYPTFEETYKSIQQ